MHISRRIAALGLLMLGGALAGCATFCDEEDDPHDPFRSVDRPLTHYDSYDRQGRSCVNATVFDVLDAAGSAD